MTSTVIVIIIFWIEWLPIFTDTYISAIAIVTAMWWSLLMEIEPLINIGRSSRNITDSNPLRQNDDKYQDHNEMFKHKIGPQGPSGLILQNHTNFCNVARFVVYVVFPILAIHFTISSKWLFLWKSVISYSFWQKTLVFDEI